MRNLLHLSFAVLICFSSCTYNNEGVSPAESDYYPTGKDSKWTYDLGGDVQLNTQISGDITIEGKKYAINGGSNLLFPSTVFVRKENGAYYARGDSYGIYTPEFVFLQDNLPVGSIWTNEIGGGDKDIYTIVAIDKIRMIAGKQYRNTIEVKRERYLNDHVTIASTVRNVYAEGIGIVASYYTYEPTGHQSQGLLTEFDIK